MLDKGKSLETINGGSNKVEFVKGNLEQIFKKNEQLARFEQNGSC